MDRHSNGQFSDKAGTGFLPRRPFATTDWRLVASAGGADVAQASEALSKLCQTYWPPLYAHVRQAGYSPPDAQDFTQQFFAHFIERNSIAQADPERGRFRSYLLVSLKNFLANEWQKSRAWKRGGKALTISLAMDDAETRCVQIAASGDTPDRAFDRQWALTLLDTVLGCLRREYADSGREALFLGLKDSLAGERAEASYRELGARLGLSESAVKAAAHRLRKRYRELLREEIARTVTTSEEIDDELRYLFAALSS